MSGRAHNLYNGSHRHPCSEQMMVCLFLYCAGSDTETKDKMLTVTKLNADENKSSCKFCDSCCEAHCLVIVFAFSMITLSLFLTLPKHTSGSVLLGNSDLLLISTFDSSQSEILLSSDELVPINFYHGLCSMVEPFQQVRNKNMSLTTIKSQPYNISSVFLMKGSQLNFSLTVLDSAAYFHASSVKIHVFIDRSHYLEFIRSGFASRFSYTLDREFMVTIMEDYQTRYYFIGLESLYNSTLNYIIDIKTLEYNTTNLSSQICNFTRLATHCSISLSHYPSSQDICLLALLEDTDTFITINYFALSHKYRMYFVATLIMWGFAFLSNVMAFFICIMCCLRRNYLRGVRHGKEEYRNGVRSEREGTNL
jgi:hypothetical protein